MNFDFKVKSSAMKILKNKNDSINIKFVYETMQMLHFPIGEHKRYWISEYSYLKIKLPCLPEQTKISLSDLTTIVGKNDIGKSTILEALDIFFEGGTIKLDKEDINKEASSQGNDTISISAIFSNLPEKINIDATNETTLRNEYLLNKNGQLEIIKRYPKAGKAQVFIKAYHPTNEGCKDLLLKKNEGLKKIENNETECSDRRVNAFLRKCIWNKYEDNLSLQEIEIDANKATDAKEIWDKLKEKMPLYFLFQSDRQNSDGDSEIQNPMQLAVKKIIQDDSLIEHFNAIADKVCNELDSTANRTLEKLKEMNPNIADSLKPIVPNANELKWESLFKSVSIESDNGISINKRGSGVKRLILLNFFRAEAEKKVTEENAPSVIYAIEEPETSQHYDHQEKLIDSFKKLSQNNNTQVFLTTHSSSIVKMLKDQDYENILLISNSEENLPKIETAKQKVLPMNSLNEVNYLILGVAEEEYHNELYGYLEENYSKCIFKQVKICAKKSKNNEDKYNLNGSDKDENQLIAMCLKKYKRYSNTVEFSSIHKYIRDQIHHPENTLNERFTKEELSDSISEMRKLIIEAEKDTSNATT